jgi:hypothetical protein
MKKWMMAMGVVLLCASAVTLAEAPRILWVSDGWNAAEPQDSGFVDVLQAAGYTVDRLQEPRNMDVAKRDLANTYDLVIVGRWADSGQFASNETEITLWNSITAPLMNMSAYLARNNRWRWVNLDSTFNTTAPMGVVVSDDPIFGGVVTDENGDVIVIAQGSVSVNATPSPGNGTLLATRSVPSDTTIWIVRWEAGQEYYANAGQYAGGPRLLFYGGEAGGRGDGVYNFTEAGKTIFLNAVYEMSGATFNRAPIIGGTADRIVYAGTDIQLTASVYEPDGQEVTTEWTVLQGPGIVTFSDPAAIEPIVSFDTKGTYRLQFTADDGELVSTAVVTVYVRDRADDQLLSHWDFEGLPDPNILVDRANGFNGIYYPVAPFDGEPNVVPGHISPTAVDFASQQYWEVPGTKDEVDPNYTSTETGLTVAVWVKVEESPIGPPMLVGYDLGGWRFQINGTRWNLVQTGINGAPQREVYSVRGAFRPEWQHVVGVFDGVNSEFRIYIDGLLDNTQALPSGYRVGSGTMPLQIGNRADADRPWPGIVDDIRVYNYALSDAEVAALAAEGDRAPYITAGEDKTVYYTGEPVQLEGVRLIDDGIPGPLALQWSVVSAPITVDPEAVIFHDPTAEDTLVTFPTVGGAYVLKLAGTDGAVEVEDEVVITLVIPTCEDVIAAGLAMPGDLTGPAGVPDCVIDLYDFAVFASGWLDCNDPQNVDCIWPF